MVTPVFLITDYRAARAFYIDWLGFRIDWEEQPDRNRIYLQVSRGDVALHLSNCPTDSSAGGVVRLETLGLPAYHHQLLTKEERPMRPTLGPAYWSKHVLEMVVTDPFGNRLIFCEPSGLKTQLLQCWGTHALTGSAARGSEPTAAATPPLPGRL